jgi:hypothetical protein
MSLLQWFSKKPMPQPQRTTMPESSGLGHVDATIPLHPSARGRVSASTGNHAANRKTERLERRELLYAVVRQSMTRAGVLSSSYKFKVLSLDSRGRQYLIMMDIARQYTGETARLAEIEGVIAKSAKTQHDILVTSVYWRVNEHVTAGLTKITPPVSGPVPLTAAPPAPATVAPPIKPRFEPLQADEVAAFKQALATAGTVKKTPAAGEVVRSGRRNPTPEPVFQDTQLDDGHSPLSGTQYGDLN